jgi:hypothetical protein
MELVGYQIGNNFKNTNNGIAKQITAYKPGGREVWEDH